MMQRKASILPAGYTQLKYIERDADNQGYIDTGIKMNPSYSMILDFNPLGISYAGSAPGFWGGYYVYFYSDSSTTYRLFPFRRYIPIEFKLTSMPLGTWQRVVLDNYYITMGGRTYEVSETSDTYNFILLSNKDLSKSYCQISYFKVSDGDTVLMELIPARRKSDSEVGMYDLVSNNFLTSPSGTIKAGPKV
ncbi:MAG: hypothetical protein ACI3ZP_08435 [Candidatus Cryptobacteroides sp.]